MYKYKKSIIFAITLIFIVFLWFGNHTGEYLPNSTPVIKEKTEAAFKPVLPGRAVRLPSDFRFHPEYQQEEWRFFADVVDQAGRHYGIQWSYYRIAYDDRLASGWQSPQLYISHIIVTSEDKVWSEQRLARGGIGQAGLRPRPFRLWMDNWNWRSLGATPLPGMLSVDTDKFSVELSSIAAGPYVLGGEKGFRKRHDKLLQASYGFSAPYLKTAGHLILDGHSISVQGNAWLNKEWGNQIINDDTRHQDKFVLRLEDGRVLELNRMLFRHTPAFYYGTLSDRNGTTIDLVDPNMIVFPSSYTRLANGHQLPMRWLISVPKQNIKMTIEPVRAEQWHSFVIPYWEGPVTAFGTHNARGFMHLSGH